ncbi:TetR/AcrR family transcriptional regulator [Streptomyces coelicoflavus]|uniref:TetR/AcrR family transcriptional regulator n=1 Tax=Streptomyces coelicoflavus TaxID=285562 RepID=A0A7K3PVJ0_9ACTN|nr:TetR family transcriptional regulator C-terminal domain-containing protein [Streptomyces coelicoflavus]NEB13998.1 TetR/AcrR family transcriptional regulator [Streptomyces coelicoflavus]
MPAAPPATPTAVQAAKARVRDGPSANVPVSTVSVAGGRAAPRRLVQYYVETKAQLLLAALRQLEEDSHARWAARPAAQHDPQSPRERVDALLAEALPTDEASRTFHLLWASCAMLAMTDPELAAQPFAEGPDRLEVRLAGLLRQAQSDGVLDREADPDAEAARLLALSHGLGTSVLVGRRTARSAAELLGYHLDRVFTPQ